METLLINSILPNALLILCRITAFFVVSPVFSYRGVPARFKIGIAVFVTLLTYTALEPTSFVAWDGAYVLAIIKEILIGLVLGFAASLFFYVVYIAGSLMDMMIGLGIANIIDPVTGAQTPVLGNFKYYLAMLLFLAMNGHHYLLLGIMNSYDWVPLEYLWLEHIANGNVSSFLLQTFIQVFVLGFQMAAPVVVALFLVDLGLGMLAKSAPQFNIFVVGFPIKILTGFIVLLMTIPGLVYLFNRLFELMFTAMNELLRTIGA